VGIVNRCIDFCLLVFAWEFVIFTQSQCRKFVRNSSNLRTISAAPYIAQDCNEQLLARIPCHLRNETGDVASVPLYLVIKLGLDPPTIRILIPYRCEEPLCCGSMQETI